MKKNDWILTLAVGLYSFLFYMQSAGINFILFNVGLIVLLGIKDSTQFKKGKRLFLMVGCLVSAFSIGWYGNLLSTIANVISLSLLASLSVNQHSSVVFGLINSFYSYFSSPVFMYLDRINRKNDNPKSELSTTWRKAWLIVIPIIITLIFFFMYKESNPLFNDFTQKIQLDFISWTWIAFTLGGFVILYGFFYHQSIKSLSDIDEYTSNSIRPNVDSSFTLFGKLLSLNDEIFSGIILFALLNGLLLVVNILDANYLFFDGTLPKGLTYSEFVHQGTGLLIFSILIAIAIILFYFRGALNFHEKSKVIRILAYLWIVQNVFMLFSTTLRNDLYISEYGLTYKRIGVYVYLFLCVLGLVTTFVKLVKIKSNMFLFRINGWLFYGVLVLATFVNWDVLITEFNSTYSKKFEKGYLYGLSDTNLPQLFELEQNTTLKQKEFILNEDYSLAVKSKSYLDSNISLSQSNLNRKFYAFMIHREAMDWRSWNYDTYRVHNDLLSQQNRGGISSLELSQLKIWSLEPLKEFYQLDELFLGENEISNTNELRHFTGLKKLDLRSNHLITLKGIEVLKNLEYLDISKNRISNFSPLYKLEKLKTLYVSVRDTNQLKTLQNNLPTTKIISSKL